MPNFNLLQKALEAMKGVEEVGQAARGAEGLSADLNALKNANILSQAREIVQSQTPIERQVLPNFNLGKGTFHEQAYPASVKIRAKLGTNVPESVLHNLPENMIDPILGGNTVVDEIKGLNPGHAEFLARQNFPQGQLYKLNTEVPTEEIANRFEKLNKYLYSKLPQSEDAVRLPKPKQVVEPVGNSPEDDE